MLKRIKKFFKWIADHTGISWMARKISSGWKWLFGGCRELRTTDKFFRTLWILSLLEITLNLF